MSGSPANFHRLESRLRLEGTLRLVTALHVGAGKGIDGTDMPVLRDTAGFPFIPGASLKGVLRSTSESLIRALDNQPGQGLWACDPLFDEKKSPQRACGVQAEGESRNDIDVSKHCSACQLFGSRILASHVRISDALMIGSEGDQPPVELRDGVAIDRDRRVAYGGQKFDFEVVRPGTSFSLEVFVENPEPWGLGLLAIAFDQISQGFSGIGGFTSRGLGRAEIEWGEVRQFTAKDLLAGKDPASLTGEKLTKEMARWQTALAEKAKENSHVQG